MVLLLWRVREMVDVQVCPLRKNERTIESEKREGGYMPEKDITVQW